MNDIEKWLNTKRVSTWGGRGWDLTDADELPMAAVWFQKQIDSFGEYLMQHATFERTTAPEPLPFEPPRKGTHESDLDFRWAPHMYGERFEAAEYWSRS